MMQQVTLIFAIACGISCFAQAPWPSSNWDVATNLTNIMSASGVEGLSGVHFNPSKNQLFLVQDNGRLRVIQLNEQTGNHLQLTDRNLGGDLEGITQINDEDNEFWVINENDYRIERFQYNANFSTVNLVRSYDLLLPQSGMSDSNDGGPEGICFVPDSFLNQSGFVSSVSGAAYTSQKGMGGLIFIAHQNLGQIWVFDVNQNVNDDYMLVGCYNTNRLESCGLSFDKSTGLLYILHNIDNNYLEVCDLSVTQVGQNFKLNKIQEFNVTIPTNGGKNIEGVALSPKCEEPQNPAVFLVRDVSGNQSTNALKQFRPFGLLGACGDLSTNESAQENEIPFYPNPSSGLVYFNLQSSESFEIEIMDLQGKLMSRQDCSSEQNELQLPHLPPGVYLLKIQERFFKLFLE
jgi:hypothetical protein